MSCSIAGLNFFTSHVLTAWIAARAPGCCLTSRTHSMLAPAPLFTANRWCSLAFASDAGTGPAVWKLTCDRFGLPGVSSSLYTSCELSWLMCGWVFDAPAGGGYIPDCTMNGHLSGRPSFARPSNHVGARILPHDVRTSGTPSLSKSLCVQSLWL